MKNKYELIQIPTYIDVIDSKNEKKLSVNFNFFS